VQKCISEAKKIDELRYSYSFEKDWYDFEPSSSIYASGREVTIYWVLLHAPVSILQTRVSKRNVKTLYEHGSVSITSTKFMNRWVFFMG